MCGLYREKLELFSYVWPALHEARTNLRVLKMESIRISKPVIGERYSQFNTKLGN